MGTEVHQLYIVFNTPLTCVHVEPAQPTPSTAPPLPCDTHPALRPSITRVEEPDARDLGGKRKKRRKERVGPVALNPDNLETNKEAGGGAQGTQGSSKSCTSRESVPPLSRLIRYFRNKYY